MKLFDDHISDSRYCTFALFRLESLPNLSKGQILTIPYIVPDEINSDILHKLAVVCLVIRNSLKFLTHLKNYS